MSKPIQLGRERSLERASLNKDDLNHPELRRLVGLSPHVDEEGEPIWDAQPVNRLVHLDYGGR
jgi:hypothetical protein